LQNYNGIEKPKKKTVEEGVQLMIDGFSGCTERDINTGDRVDLVILNKDGSSELRTSPLRFD
jgi:20S proteasome alpha/beta subunit